MYAALIVLAFGVAPPAALTPEQEGVMRRRAAQMAEAVALVARGDGRGAGAAFAKADALLEQVEGPLSLALAARWRSLAGTWEIADRLEAADAMRTKAAAVYARLLG